jgi:hypothetical protein
LKSSSNGQPNKRLQDASIACFSNIFLAAKIEWLRSAQLKRIYKASQEKKERTSPKGAEWFLFLPNSTQ